MDTDEGWIKVSDQKPERLDRVLFIWLEKEPHFINSVYRINTGWWEYWDETEEGKESPRLMWIGNDDGPLEEPDYWLPLQLPLVVMKLEDKVKEEFLNSTVKTIKVRRPRYREAEIMLLSDTKPCINKTGET